MKTAIYSLFEKSYHKGFAGLCNSLHSHEYTDNAVGFHRGAPPPWQVKASPDMEHAGLTLPNGMEVVSYPVGGNRHLTYCKAQQGLELFSKYPELQNLFYFDPDIIVTRKWSYYKDWVSFGIGAVMDPIVQPPSSPYWQALTSWAKDRGYKQVRAVPYNLNAGYFCIMRQHLSFLEIWARLINDFLSDFPTCETNLAPAMQSFPYCFVPDQDLFCFAMSLGDWPLSIGGPHEMGFHWGIGAMQHAIGTPKPWQEGILAGWFKRSKQSQVFHHFSGYPIRIESPLRRRLRQIPYRLLNTK